MIKNNPKLKEYDSVELLVDRDRYAKHGVYKGMQGWICFAKEIEGFSLVNFPCYGDHPDIATISVRDEDLRIITKAEGTDLAGRLSVLFAEECGTIL